MPGNDLTGQEEEADETEQPGSEIDIADPRDARKYEEALAWIQGREKALMDQVGAVFIDYDPRAVSVSIRKGLCPSSPRAVGAVPCKTLPRVFSPKGGGRFAALRRGDISQRAAR